MISKVSRYYSRGKISFFLLWISFRDMCFCFLLVSSFFSFFLTLFLFFPFLLFQCIMMVKFLGLFGKKKKQSKTENNPPKKPFKQCQMAFLLSDLSVRVFCWPLYQNRQPAWQPRQPEWRVSWIWLRKRYFLPSLHSNELIQVKGQPGEKKSSPWWLWPCLLVREAQTGQQR